VRVSAPSEKKDVSYSRPPGRLAPDPAELSWASLALAILEYRARRGEIILPYEDVTILGRCALPRAAWWPSKAPRFRLSTRPRRRPSQRDEALKRQAWGRYRRWSRVTSGVWLSVMGAVHYGTSQVF
jgi:hypothetical protein